MRARLWTALVAGSPFVAAVAPPPLMTVVLQPGPVDDKAGKGALDVTLTLSESSVAAGEPLLTLPVVIANTDTIADTMTGLTVMDADGPLPLSVRDDPKALAYSRHWIAGRAVHGAMTVRYHATIDDRPPAKGSGPPYGLRTEGAGVSGVGNTFVLTPETRAPYRIALRWNLSALGSGATATSSYGEGDLDLPPGPVDRLTRTVFMAGPLHREPARVTNDGFSSAWLGDPPFDPRPLMGWGGRLHAWMSRFFEDASEPPYRIFLRYNPINAGGGAAMFHSFLVTWGGQAVDPDRLKGTLSHEMVHTWTATGTGQWYSEGNAVHYQMLLPLRAGLATPAEYLKDINSTASRYYSNALNRTPDVEVAPRFWEDTRIRTLPYDRGAMYFAVLDGRIRRASHGRRSVDDLVLAMDRIKADRGTATTADWRRLVLSELGPDGPALLDSMLAGDLMTPESGDFGPCFARVVGAVRRFELGFEPKSLVGDVKVIRGLEPSSNAALAGLRDGDVVTYAVAMDSVQGDPERRLTMNVTRAGHTFPVTYLPRGASTPIQQWRRVATVPDRACVQTPAGLARAARPAPPAPPIF